jgi:hypothetical protein
MDVYDYLIDMRNEQMWNDGLKTIVMRTESPVRVGTVFEAEWKGSGHQHGQMHHGGAAVRMGVLCRESSDGHPFLRHRCRGSRGFTADNPNGIGTSRANEDFAACAPPVIPTPRSE